MSMTQTPSSLPILYISEQLNRWLDQHGFGDNLAFRAELERAIDHYTDQYQKFRSLDRPNALSAVFNSIEEFHDRIDSNANIQCKKGCSFCCHISVSITADEAHFIGQFCKKNNIKISKKYLKHQLSIHEKEIPLSSASACVFLKDKTCTIYPARPLNCRKHMVVTEPKYCNTKLTDNSQAINYFDLSTEKLIAGVFNSSPVDRMPKQLLPYSK